MQTYREREAYHLQRLQDNETAKHRRIWARYGTTEIRRASWKQEADGTWSAEAVFNVYEENPVQLKELPVWATAPKGEAFFKRFDESLDVLVRHGIVDPNQARRLKNPYAMGAIANRIAVNCAALTVNEYQLNAWKGWVRPDAGQPYEQLVIDRCGTESK
jgi:hypothetical protein